MKAVQSDLASPSKPSARWIDRGLAGLILFAIALAIVETEPTVALGREDLFEGAELSVGAVFAVEYLFRFWNSAKDERFGGGWTGRLRWAVTPLAICDLLALAPLVLPAFGATGFILRLVRLLRLLRLARLGRFSMALRLLGGVVWSRRFELAATAAVGLAVLIVSSTALYLAEGARQPAAFGSIPRSLWWGVVTLTTVGYGDVYPVTATGRVLASITALVGIGIVAAPTGILAAGFSDALQSAREVEKPTKAGA